MKKQNEILTNKEFLEKLGKAFHENKEILTIGGANEGIEEALEEIQEYHKTIYETQDHGYVTIDSHCITNARI